MTKGLNRNQLKYIAIVAMLIDHTAALFVPFTTPLGPILRIIGRLTAPIMCYFIAEGYYYTRSKKNYGIRLFIFAVISQFAYSFALHNTLFCTDFSVIFTLFIGFIVLLIYDKVANRIIKWLLIIILVLVSFLGDWGVVAPLWILGFWIYRDDKKKKFIAFSAIAVLVIAWLTILNIQNNNHWYGSLWQLGIYMVIPFLLSYNGEKGVSNGFNKWVFYIFYPLHLLILGLIKMFLA